MNVSVSSKCHVLSYLLFGYWESFITNLAEQPTDKLREKSEHSSSHIKLKNRHNFEQTYETQIGRIVERK